MRSSIVLTFTAALLLPWASGFIAAPRLRLCARHDRYDYNDHGIQVQRIVHQLPPYPHRMLSQTSLVNRLQAHLTPSRRRLIAHGGLPCMATSEGKDQNENNRSQAEGASKEKGIYGLDPEIIERETAEAPFRRFRLAAYGALAVAAVLLGGVSVAGLAGVDSARELGRNLPNPILDAAVLGVAFYLWVEEVKTKRSALRLMEKRLQEKNRVPNRATRRQQKKNKDREAQTEATPAAPRQKPPSSAARRGGETRDDISPERQTPSTVSNSDSGMFGGMRKTLEAVNQQSYYQALALNKELEDKGVLPRLDRKLDLLGDEATAAGADFSRDSDGSFTATEDSSAGRRRVEMDTSQGGVAGKRQAVRGGDATTGTRREKNRGDRRKIIGKNRKK